MPITVSTGISKKVGTANYGSVGANCNVSFEVGHDLLENDLDGFHRKVKNAFVACRQAVQDELARELNAPASNGNGATNGHAVEPSHNGSNGNGGGNNHAANGSQTNGNGSNGNGYGANGNGSNGNGRHSGNGRARPRSNCRSPSNSPRASRAWASAAWKPSPRRCSASRWRR